MHLIPGKKFCTFLKRSSFMFCIFFQLCSKCVLLVLLPHITLSTSSAKCKCSLGFAYGGSLLRSHWRSTDSTKLWQETHYLGVYTYRVYALWHSLEDPSNHPTIGFRNDWLIIPLWISRGRLQWLPSRLAGVYSPNTRGSLLSSPCVLRLMTGWCTLMTALSDF